MNMAESCWDIDFVNSPRAVGTLGAATLAAVGHGLPIGVL